MYYVCMCLFIFFAIWLSVTGMCVCVCACPFHQKRDIVMMIEGQHIRLKVLCHGDINLNRKMEQYEWKIIHPTKAYIYTWKFHLFSFLSVKNSNSEQMVYWYFVFHYSIPFIHYYYLLYVAG